MTGRDPELEALATRLRSRLKRVEALGEELAGAIQSWRSSEPVSWHTVVADDRLSWSLCVQCEPPPFDEWGVIFSDAIHQLRSTLDNLAWGLAHLRDAVPSKPRAIQFPITSDAKDWPSEARRIAELPVAARVAIETVQPFQRTHVGERAEQDGLLLLNSLNNVDKHRILIQPTVNPLQISHSFSISFRDELEAGRDYDPPDVTLSADLFATEATLVVQRTKTPIESVEGDYHVTAQVVVEDPVHGALGVTTVLGQLLTYVPKVLDHVLLAVAGDLPSAR